MEGHLCHKLLETFVTYNCTFFNGDITPKFLTFMVGFGLVTPLKNLMTAFTYIFHGRVDSLPKSKFPLLQRLRRKRDVRLAGRLLFGVLFDPVFPVLAGGAILAAELDAGDLGEAHFALFGRGG